MTPHCPVKLIDFSSDLHLTTSGTLESGFKTSIAPDFPYTTGFTAVKP
jgi:hypothetical protein